MKIFCVLCGITSLAGATLAQAQDIRGRVIDEPSRSALPGTFVWLLRSDSSTIVRTSTDNQGFFRVHAPSVGEYLVRVERDGFSAQVRNVRITEPAELVVPAFVMVSTLVRLDPVEAKTDRPDTAATAVGFSRAGHIAAGERMKRLDRAGVSAYAVVRELTGSLRIRDIKVRNKWIPCIESTRRIGSMNAAGANACDFVALIIDGVSVPDPLTYFYDHVRVRDLESMEYLPPVEAGVRYGMDASAKGALVLWTRGSGPHKSAARSDGS